MTDCTGTPAELCALPYIEGSLPENETERFEEHFFDCPVCLGHLQAVQAAGQALARQPIAVETARPRLLSWPVWAMAAAAAVLLTVGAVTYREVFSHPAQPSVAQKQPDPPAPAPQPANSVRAKASQLADLALPAFIAPNLRGASEDAHYQAGMKAYAQGRCPAAVAELAKVPAQDANARTAAFYVGACQMHMGNLAAAAVTLHSVAAQGDSPQQESALYYLAQVALARNDAGTAHRLLQHTIALQGDLEARARAEDRKIMTLSPQDRGARTTKLESK